MSATNPESQYEFFKYIRLTEDGRLLISADGIVNDTYVIAGSVDVLNSELVLNRNDGAEVRIDAAEFLSDAYVVSGVYDPNTQTITFTNNLGGTFDVTGFELNTTASNGLTEIGNDIQLGGDLTKPTIINKDGNIFAVNGDGPVSIASEDDDVEISGFGDVNIESQDSRVNITSDNGINIGTNGLLSLAGTGVPIRIENINPNVNFRGMAYASDYTTDWDALTLDNMIPTKGYVDRLVTDGVTASNGLTEVGGDIQLGGTLDTNTTIDINSNGLTFTNGAGIGFYGNQNIEFAGQQNLRFVNAGGDVNFSGFENMILANSNTDLTQQGIKYFLDYSTTWDATTPDAMLATKGYVDRLVQDGVTASNGLTEVGGDIQLGGLLTQDTTISLDNNSISTVGTGTESILFDTADEFLVNNVTNVEFNFGSSFNVANGFQNISLDSTNVTEIKSQSNILISANEGLVGGGIEMISEQSSISLEAADIEARADLTLIGGSTTNITLDNINNTFRLGVLGNSLTYNVIDRHIFVDNSNALTNKGVYYNDDYSLNWDDTTPSEVLATKSYVDRKSFYTMSFGRGGNVNPNAYLRAAGGNVVGTASRGSLVSLESKIEGITYFIQNADAAGSYEILLRVYNSDGTLYNQSPFSFAATPGQASHLDFPTSFLGWDGILQPGMMVAMQFRVNDVVTQINNPQLNLKLSIQ